MEGIATVFFLPVIATLGTFAMVLLIVYWVLKSGDRKRQLEHELRMAAIEKGVDIPLPPVREKNPYIWPLIWIGLGLAILIGLGIVGDEWYWGFIPLFVGAAMLIARLIFRKQKKEDGEKKELPEITTTEGGTYDAS